MEPQSSTPYSNQPVMPAPGGQQPGWKPSKKLIIIGAVLIIAAAAIVISLFTSGNSGSNSADGGQTSSESFYHDREGYPRNTLNVDVGDPLAVIFKKDTTNIQTIDATTVLPGCAVITQADIKAVGLRIQPGPFAGSSEMQYIDGHGSGGVPYADLLTPTPDETNDCTYTLTDGGSVKVEVLQPYFVSEQAIAGDLQRNYGPGSDLAGFSGVRLYTQKADSPAASDGTAQYYIRKGTEVSLKLRVTLKDDRQAKSDQLIKAVTKNMNRLISSPEGAPSISYDSPTFKQSYLKACDFLTDNDMQKLANQPAARFVNQAIANATGIVQFSEVGDQKYYNYIENKCSRRAASAVGVIRTPRMEVTTVSYTSSKAAELRLKVEAQKDQAALKVQGIGDEAIITADNIDNNTLIFREGRFVVSLLYNTLDQRKSGLNDKSKLAQTLTPYAKHIVPRVK